MQFTKLMSLVFKENLQPILKDISKSKYLLQVAFICKSILFRYMLQIQQINNMTRESIGMHRLTHVSENYFLVIYHFKFAYLGNYSLFICPLFREIFIRIITIFAILVYYCILICVKLNTILTFHTFRFSFSFNAFRND